MQKLQLALLGGFASFVITVVLLKVFIRLAPKWRLLDRPHEYGITDRQPIPYSAGIVFYLVFCLVAAFMIGGARSQLFPALIVSATIIAAISFIDDRVRLSPWIRLAAQLLAAGLLITGGVSIQVISNPFGAPFLLDGISFQLFGTTVWLFSAILILGWLIVMTNTVNWLDGIPGQASGIMTIAFFALLLLALKQFHVVDQTLVIILASALGASALALWLFDFPPPRLLMGDTGSMLLGFMLGALAIIAGGKFATALLIMSFPILDAVIVVGRRLLRGGSPVRGDYSHLHHQLLRAGLRERQILYFYYGITAVFASIALLLDNTFSKFILFGTVMILLPLVLYFLSKKTSG